jgi:hypothetical protein
VIGVDLDWDYPREAYYCKSVPEGLAVSASGYPRSLPGVSRAKNLHGISFAVANASGFVVRACEGLENRSYDKVCAAMADNAGLSPAS